MDRLDSMVLQLLKNKGLSGIPWSLTMNKPNIHYSCKPPRRIWVTLEATVKPILCQFSCS